MRILAALGEKTAPQKPGYEKLIPRTRAASHRLTYTTTIGRGRTDVKQVTAARVDSAPVSATVRQGDVMLSSRALAAPALAPLACLVAVPIYTGLLLVLHEPMAAQLTTAAVFAASLLSSLAGFAFSALCGAMLFQFRHDPVAVVQIMLLCSLANQSLSVWLLRREIDWRQLLPFLLPGATGVLCGVFALLHLQVDTYVRVLGCILIAYGAYMLMRPPITVRQPGIVGDAISGFFGGVLGGLAATPGAPVSIWCVMKGWDKTRQRALYQPFIMIMQIVALVAIPAMRESGSAQLGFPPMVYLYVPAGLMGTVVGFSWFRRMTGRQFHIAVDLLLAISGAGLLV